MKRCKSTASEATKARWRRNSRRYVQRQQAMLDPTKYPAVFHELARKAWR